MSIHTYDTYQIQNDTQCISLTTQVYGLKNTSNVWNSLDIFS